MALLARKKQLVSVVEAVAGTTPAGAFTNTANADQVLNTAEPSFEVDGIQRDFLRETISSLKGLPGQKTMDLSIAFEMAGNSDNTYASGVPAWSKFLEMSGFRLVEIRAMRLDSSAAWTGDGPIRHGEFVTDDAAVNYARVVGDVHEGDNYIFYEPPKVVATGADATEMIGSSTSEGTPGLGWTAQDTGVIFDTHTSGGGPDVVSETTNAGWAWIPVSEPEKKITISTPGSAVSIGAVYEGATSGAIFIVTVAASTSDTELHFRPSGTPATAGETLNLLQGTGPATLTVDGTPAEQFTRWPTGSFRLNQDGTYNDMSGARGSISFEFEVNRPVIATFTPRGRWDDADDAPLITSTAELNDPPLWGGVVTNMAPNEGTGDELYADYNTPCMKSLTLDMGVELADVKCANATDGLKEIQGSSRAASGSMVVSTTFENDIPVIQSLRGGEVQRLLINTGSNITGLNAVSFRVPAAQLTGASYGDENGELTTSADFTMNAGVIDNLNPVTADNLDGEVSSTSGDNELIIMYITSIS